MYDTSTETEIADKKSHDSFIGDTTINDLGDRPISRSVDKFLVNDA